MPLHSCPHCGSALAAPDPATAALRCPTCGATLSAALDTIPEPEALPIREAIVREEDDSATRAVAPERMAPIIAQATSDHLSTQSAIVRPADETTQTTQALPYSAAAASATDARTVTQELPPSALPQQPPEQPEPPARRSAGGVMRAISMTLAALTLVAVVIVAALAANGVLIGGATPAAQATATSAPIAPTATPTVGVFSVPGLYQVSYPQGWLIQQRNSPPKTYYALLTAPSGGASVNIEAQQATDAPAPAILDQQFLAALAQPGTTPTPVGVPLAISVGGEKWIQLTADVTLRVASGQPAQFARVIVLSTQYGDYVYTIVCLAPSPSAAAAGPAFTTADTAYFQPLLASFTFAS